MQQLADVVAVARMVEEEQVAIAEAMLGGRG